jgi:hypothetical protein
MEVSPDGRFALVYLRLTNPMAYLGYPVIVDLRDPSRRHYLEGFDYRWLWTTDAERPSKKEPADAAKRAADMPRSVSRHL